MKASEAFIYAANQFETYAGDIQACIDRGYYKGKALTIEQARRAEQIKLAAELREYAATTVDE